MSIRWANIKCSAARPSMPHDFPLFKESRATLISELENKIDSPVIKFILSITYSCLGLFLHYLKLIYNGLAIYQQFVFP